MRTTVTLDDSLYRRLKTRAAESGRSVSDLVEDAVRVALRPRRPNSAETPALPIFGGSGVLPGVDLTSGAALRDVMDEDRDVDALR